MDKRKFHRLLLKFRFNSKSAATAPGQIMTGGKKIPVFANEFWTPRQRQAHSIHEVSYRACFKPQLPRFFIDIFTEPGNLVYDPFNGRGTTVVEAALMGRNVIANDVNPLSLILARPRVSPPLLADVEKRLQSIKFKQGLKADIDLSMFYEKATLSEIVSLREYLKKRVKKGLEDDVDRWIRMVATNRLSGHSKGFFSVYTLPPNQAMSALRQKKVNKQRKQRPEYRDVKALIWKKSKALMRDLETEYKNQVKATYLNSDAAQTKKIKSNTVTLTVTSPPFLDVIQYAADNWLRCWFNDIDITKVEQQITMSKTVEEWSAKMQLVFAELYRITKPNGVVAFEVGEVRGGKIRLEEAVVPLGIKAGFSCDAILINEQVFTKTANIWGVGNNTLGTNSNRIVVFRKP